MKAFAAALLVLVAACGEGRAIFNIDAYSFLAGTGKDTIPYNIPAGLSGTASTVQKINLPPGFGSSGIDSIGIRTGSANLINATGSGSIGFQLFFASDSAATYSAPMALNIPPTNVSGAQTVPVVITGDLTGVVDSLFKQQTLWMRIAATANNTGVTALTGKGALTALVIRVILQDKIF
ncbi:MAG TPA: hypothetical protein VIV83_04965 [Gemmatimonadales bacterium]|jgi:hypothetical protein